MPMSEQANEVTAAATGAAAAVAAVQDDQAEAERAASIELDAAIATDAATQAAEQAQQAAQAATAASEVAVGASEQAAVATGVATEAVTEAYDAREHIEQLRVEVRQGWQDLRTHLDETFGPKQTDQPTEVVVTDARPADNSTESRSDTGSAGSASQPGDTDRRPRHRFGTRRS